MVRFLHLLLAVLLVGGAAAQEFPFKNGPLDPSLHSNKIFFQNITIDDVAGVWKLMSWISLQLAEDTDLYRGNVPINEICQRARDSGVIYSWAKQYPWSMIVVPGSEVEGELGSLYWAHDTLSRSAILELTDERIRWEDETQDGCVVWRPYFDWEVGRPMYVRNRRQYYWMEDDDTFQNAGGPFCVYGGVDHPNCEEGTFVIDGQEKTGVILDMVYFYECVAGPCLELPHTLPGFVKTQGWQPRA